MEAAPASGQGDFELRLRGARAPAVALGAVALLVLGVVELALGEAHTLAHWWWAPAVMVLPLVVMMTNTMRGVLVRGTGDVLIAERLVSRRRIAASTISDIHLAGLLDERIEVVRDSGRTWAFTAADSPAADRIRAVALAHTWLDAHGGPVPISTGPLRDGEVVAFAPVRGVWVTPALIGVMELVLLGLTLHDLAAHVGPVWLASLALALEVAALATVVWAFWRFVGARAEVHGDAVHVRRPFSADQPLPAREITAIQVTWWRQQTFGLRVRTQAGWSTLPSGLASGDRALPVVRFRQWATDHGAVLEVSDDAPPLVTGRQVAIFLIIIGSWLAAALLKLGQRGGFNPGILGGFFGVAGSVFGRTRTADASRLSADQRLRDAFAGASMDPSRTV